MVIEPTRLLEISTFLRDDPRLQFDILNCITGVDYLEPEAKKVAKAGFEPHLEVVYHLSSFVNKNRFVVKLLLPRWKDGVPDNCLMCQACRRFGGRPTGTSEKPTICVG